ncbi:NGCA protein, partial [Alcedo cyanopectus]|nr:NGCA protein [Ceyx cyanopectus]
GAGGGVWGSPGPSPPAPSCVSIASCRDRFSVSGDTLTVSGVDYGDQGTFSCRAWTPLDAVEAEAQLRVVGRPGPVRELQVLELGERQVRLSWTPGDDHNSPVQ